MARQIGKDLQVQLLRNLHEKKNNCKLHTCGSVLFFAYFVLCLSKMKHFEKLKLTICI